MRKIILVTILVLGVAATIIFDVTSSVPAVALNQEGLIAPASFLTVSFSHECGFYDESFSVDLSCTAKGADIYFTLDGSPPSVDSLKYTAPIPVSSESDVTATTIKAIAVKDGEASRITTQSYVTGKNVFERFDPSSLVFVLSIDPFDLYDYYEGIANDGYLRDEYKASINYTGGELNPDTPANYNKEGKEEAERPVYVEVFDSEGNYLLSQSGGAQVKGGWSRAVYIQGAESHADPQMSWQLYARKEYDESGKFKYPFYGTDLSSDGQLITKYDSIRLRNNGNDRDQGAIRDELSQELAKQAGFPDTQLARPTAVFMNGEYYGFSWLKEPYSNGYLESRYGGVKENYQVVQTGERARDGESFAVDDYTYVYSLAQNGLSSDAKFEEFCSLVDIDNLILYYATQVYINNKDWPNNNIKMYRYYASPDEEVTNPFNDGKWRFLMYDMEFAWSLYSITQSDDTLYNILNGVNHMGGKSVFLSALLEREDMRTKFANTMCDLIDGAFNPENVNRVLDELVEISHAERIYALTNDRSTKWGSEASYRDNHDRIRMFAMNRPDVIYTSLRSNLGFDKMYGVSFTVPDGAEAFLNTRKLAQAGTITGNYYDGGSLEVGVKTYSGYEFDYWRINGANYYEESMTVDSDMAVNGEIKIELNLKKFTGQEKIYISAVHSGKDGWIELHNPNQFTFSTENLYLSDSIDNLLEWKIPLINISPEGSLMIVCKNNKTDEALLKAQANFSIKDGEVLYLSDVNGEILSYVNIVEMKNHEELRRQVDGSYMKRRSASVPFGMDALLLV